MKNWVSVKKKVLSGLVIAALVLLVLPRFAVSEEIVTPTTNVYLRGGPGLNQKVVGSLREGEPLKVLGKKGVAQEIDGMKSHWYVVRRSDGSTGFAFGGFLKPVKSSSTKLAVKSSASSLLVEEEARVTSVWPVRSDILPALLKKRGYTPPDTFKALLIEITRDEHGTMTYFPMDYLGTSEDIDDWWPASTVKLYAAVAALEKSRAMGFPPQTELTFHYEEEPVTQTLEEIVRRAITDSKNPEFDRLVEFVGADRLNKYFLTARKGLPRTVMLRAYSGRVKHPITQKSLNKHSPRISLRFGDKTKELKEQTAKGKYHCHNNGNCTTLRELTEAIRRVMMHESLPKSDRYKLGRPELKVLRSALKGKWAKGGVNDGLRAAFKGRPIEIFHKGGYADGWFSDNIFLKVKDTKEQWIVAMVNRPGRESLDEAALHVAELLASGELSAARKKAFRAEVSEVNARSKGSVDVVARETWEADPPTKQYVRHEIKRLTIHHQGVSFKDAKRAPNRLRTMQSFHTSDEKAFADLAYHFIIDPAGNIYQGRPYWAKGETETDYDPEGHLLVCLLGDFEAQQPEEVQLESLVKLLTWASREFSVSPDTIEGHRDHAHTTCPGKHMYTLIKDKTLANRVKEAAQKTVFRLNLLSGDAGQKKILAIKKGKPKTTAQ